MRTPPLSALAAVTLAVAVAPAALAAPETIAISGSGHDEYSLAADVGARDSALVGWTTLGTAPRAQVSWRPAGGRPFQRAVTLGRGRMARVAVADSGTAATAAWIDGGRLRTARRDARGRWRADRLPSGVPTGQGIGLSGLVARADGTAVAALESRTGERWTVTALARSANGAWRRAGPDLTADETSAGRSLVSPGGTVEAVWVGGSGSRTADVLVAARLAPGEPRWSAARVIARAPGGGVLSEPQIAAGGAGTVAVLVSASDRATARPLPSWVAVRDRRGTWRASRPTPGTTVAVSPSGGVLTAWMARGAATVARLGTRGRWITSRPPAARGTVVGGPGLAVSGGGRAIVWWVLDGGAAADRWMVDVQGPRGWSGPSAVGRTNGGMEIVGARSAGLAAWADADGRGRIMAAPVTG